MLNIHHKGSLNCFRGVEFYDTFKSRDQIQSTTSDIFMKRKLGVMGSYFLYDFYTKKATYKEPSMLYFCV